MNILIAVTGGIAAYKVPDIISGLKTHVHKCHVVVSENAKKFVHPNVMGTLSDGHYIDEDDPNNITHITEARWADLFICVPATANTIAKFAHGMADNLVTSTYLAMGGRARVVCPAMNTHMYTHPATQRNIAQLKADGCYIIDPVVGMLACGDKGVGKLPKPRAIVDEILQNVIGVCAL